MSNTVKVYLAIVALIVAAAVPAGLLSARSAGASTTACGSSCTGPYNESLGSDEELTVSGTSVVMSAASTSNSAEDWTPDQEGDVANAVAAGVVSARLNMLYSTDPLVEYQYAPDGVPSDQCLANTATAAGSSTTDYVLPTLTVVLAQCGLTAQSLWIVDASNEANGYVDLINAGYATQYSYPIPTGAVLGNVTATDNQPLYLTSPFAEPAVLTVNSSGKAVLAPLSEIGGVVSSSQMWADWSSPAQSALQAKVGELRAKAGKSS
jgi:hypothetical protein